MKWKRWRYLLFFGVIGSVGACQTAPLGEVPLIESKEIISSVSPASKPKIQVVELDSLQKESQKTVSFPFSALQFGYVLYDPTSKVFLESHQREVPFIPASAMKVVTSLFGLRVLGSAFRFSTQLLSFQEEGHSALVLRGGGDPFLKQAHLLSLIQKLKQKGLFRFHAFYFDEGLYQSQPALQLRRDRWAAYNPGLSALSLDFNVFRVFWKPRGGKGPSLQKIRVLPPGISEMRFGVASSSLMNRESGWEKEGDVWKIAPHLTQGGQVRLPLSDPGRVAAEQFYRLALQEGVSIPFPKPFAERVLVEDSFALKELAHHLSLPLEEQIRFLLETSHNLSAELILLRAAHELERDLRPLSLGQASEVAMQWMKKHIFSDIETSLFFENGSGLSSRSRISPGEWIPILKFADQLSETQASFQSLLPVAGGTGTLQNRMVESEAAFRVFAKTGTLAYVRTLVGYVYTRSGKRLMFALQVQDLEARARVDAEPGPLSDGAWRASQDWQSRAGEWMEGKLEQWIHRY